MDLKTATEEEIRLAIIDAYSDKRHFENQYRHTQDETWLDMIDDVIYFIRDARAELARR